MVSVVSSDQTKPLPEAPSTYQPSDQIRRIGGWRRLVVLPLALVVRVWARSLRFDIDPESLAAYKRFDGPLAFILWHNRLFLAAEVVRRYREGRKAYALVSASKDGAWLDAFFDMVGLRCVRGSSSRLGREAASALIEVVRAGNDIGITPDGPRGPCYDFKPGALIVARRTHIKLILLGMDYHSSWRLKSWDRFIVPLPFSRVTIRAKIIPADDIAGDRNEAAATIKALLLEMNPDRDS